MVQRYDIGSWIPFRGYKVIDYLDESDIGDYILYSDHLIAMKEKDKEHVAELNKEIACLKKQIERHKEDAESRSKVIADLRKEQLCPHCGGKIELCGKCTPSFKTVSEDKLSRLTVALNDDERAEKVAHNHSHPLTCLAAINDYRTELGGLL